MRDVPKKIEASKRQRRKTMKAKELIKQEPITIGRNENLLAAKTLMKDKGIRHLVVIEDAAGYPESVAGVLSELHAATDGQRMLRQQVESLQQERDVLLDELEKAGAVSKQQLRSVAKCFLQAAPVSR